MHLPPYGCQNPSLVQALAGMRHFHPFGLHLEAYRIALQVSFKLKMTTSPRSILSEQMQIPSSWPRLNVCCATCRSVISGDLYSGLMSYSQYEGRGRGFGRIRQGGSGCGRDGKLHKILQPQHCTCGFNLLCMLKLSSRAALNEELLHHMRGS